MATPRGGINGTLESNLLGLYHLDGTYDGNDNISDIDLEVVKQFGQLNSFGVDMDGEEDKALTSNNFAYAELALPLPFDLTTQFSLSFWCKIKDDSGKILELRTSTGSITLQLKGCGIETTTETILFEPSIPINNWLNLTIINDTSMKVYINSVLHNDIEQASMSISPFWSIMFRSIALDGLDEIRLYDRVLSQSEITEITEMGVNYVEALPEVAVSVDSVTFDSIILTAENVSNFDHFSVKYRIKGSGDNFVEQNVPELTITLDTLSPETEYEIIITAKDIIDEGLATTQLELTTLQILFYSIEEKTLDSVLISVETVTFLDGIVAEYRIKGSGSDFIEQSSATTSVLITSLTQNKIYECRIIAKDIGESVLATTETFFVRTMTKHIVGENHKVATTDILKLESTVNRGIDFLEFSWQNLGENFSYKVSIKKESQTIYETEYTAKERYKTTANLTSNTMYDIMIEAFEEPGTIITFDTLKLKTMSEIVVGNQTTSCKTPSYVVGKNIALLIKEGDEYVMLEPGMGIFENLNGYNGVKKTKDFRVLYNGSNDLFNISLKIIMIEGEDIEVFLPTTNNQLTLKDEKIKLKVVDKFLNKGGITKLTDKITKNKGEKFFDFAIEIELKEETAELLEEVNKKITIQVLSHK